MKDKKRIAYSKILNAKKGSVLIIALWSLFFITFFTVTLSGVITQKLNVSGRINEEIREYFAARAGIELAKAVLATLEPEEYDTSYDSWANNEKAFKEQKIGDAIFSVSYTIKTKSPDPVTVYGLIDEERKLNINKADAETLTRFFGFFEIEKADELASSVIDWRDEDSETTKGGAEKSYYNRLQYPYSPRDGLFESIYELPLVKGMDDEFFEAIKDYVTVFGEGRININTAQREALNAIGFSEPLITKITEYRNGIDAKPFTPDDRPFKSAAEMKSDLDAFKYLSDDEKKQIDKAVSEGLIGVKSQYFEVRATGTLGNKGKGTIITAIISRDGEVVFWNE
jgi:general secretion pathway protein K